MLILKSGQQEVYLKNYKLGITRGVFTSGAPLSPYLKAMDIDLFLTANSQDAQEAIDEGIPAATLVMSHMEQYKEVECDNEIRIAFDGDAVLFSEESEVIYKTKGLDAFATNEEERAEEPMQEGPFAKFLKAIAFLQKEQKTIAKDGVKIRTALVTARNAPAHERVIKTLRHWDVRIDEAFFLGGLSKTPLLKAFRAQIFFDDQKKYSEAASTEIPAATVPYESAGVLHTLNVQEKK